VATAVVLLGTRGLSEAEPLRFVPVVCAILGKLATGKACGLAMPARARVRMTRPDARAPSSLAIERSTRPFRDTNGDHVYPAPAGPECCMYNTCLGETIPYHAIGAARAPERAVLAVWPETADVDLKPRPQGVDLRDIEDAPWRDQADMRLEQGVSAASLRLVSARSPVGCQSCATLWARSPLGWARVEGLGMGADGYDILATTDVDGDGRPEAIVYEVWRNDYGLHVLAGDGSKPVHRFSCGNI
jgi:hypothetical protein